MNEKDDSGTGWVSVFRKKTELNWTRLLCFLLLWLGKQLCQPGVVKQQRKKEKKGDGRESDGKHDGVGRWSAKQERGEKKKKKREKWAYRCSMKMETKVGWGGGEGGGRKEEREGNRQTVQAKKKKKRRFTADSAPFSLLVKCIAKGRKEKKKGLSTLKWKRKRKNNNRHALPVCPHQSRKGEAAISHWDKGGCSRFFFPLFSFSPPFFVVITKVTRGDVATWTASVLF